MSKFTIIVGVLLQFLLPAKFDHYGVLIIPIGKVPNSLIYPDSSERYDYSKWLIRNNHGDITIETFDKKNTKRPMEIKNKRDRGHYNGFREGFSYGDDKIVGGIEVDIDSYPYHAAYGFNCAASLIHEKWALTAGHCGKKNYIRVGSKYVHQGRKVPVKQQYIHPEWEAAEKAHPFDFDFQLLELGETLKFDENVQAIKIGRREDMVVGTLVTVTGWGYTVENGPYSNVLRAIRVPMISKELCQNVPFPYFRGLLTRRMFCAGFTEGKMDACQGDSGGPAVGNNRLLGVISFGYGCATPGAYGVYGKVSEVRSWIMETTGVDFD